VTFDGAERDAPGEELLRFQRQLLEARPNPQLHDVLARDNGVFAVFSDQVGFDGHSTHVGGAYVVAPDGSMVVSSESGRETAWVAADLDPELLRVVRENPWFALRKRRPETYEELTRAL
jgi:predicted amidohydrolase